MSLSCKYLMGIEGVTVAFKILLLCFSIALLAPAELVSIIQGVSAQSSSQPLRCSASPPQCTAMLYYFVNGGTNPFDTGTLNTIAQNFNVHPTDMYRPPPPLHFPAKDFLIPVNCTCNAKAQYLATVIYTPSKHGSQSSYTQILQNAYQNLSYIDTSKAIPIIKGTNPVQVQLLCGCVSQTAQYSYMVTYNVQIGDNVFSIANNLQANSQDIMTVNDLPGDPASTILSQGQTLFVPLPYTADLQKVTPTPDTKISGPRVSNISLIVGIIIGLVVLAVVFFILMMVCWRRQFRSRWSPRELSGPGSLSKHIQIADEGPLPAKAAKWSDKTVKYVGNMFNYNKFPEGVNKCVRRSVTLQREAKNVFDQEKPVIFKYQEIVAATDGFNASKKLGRGAFGEVYSGKLRDQEVAIKEMKATKSREFFAELNVLCNVHHANLVELIGYSAGEQSLFLVYEFAEHGALSEHLHISSGKDFVPLTWTSRVQIALDAARGLEYIHDHTKSHYVHRDVKTSNILLDADHRAMVSDFGFAKLVEHSVGDNVDTVSRIVGTDGYIAPEYMLSGIATPKVDVYAFGVVLFELITGREAVERTGFYASARPGTRRSIISLMVNVLQMEPVTQEQQFKFYVDKRMENCYPYSYVYQMAQLAQLCVQVEAARRPKMSQVVLALSQILLNSIEWEASLAGNSAIFSGLAQGR